MAIIPTMIPILGIFLGEQCIFEVCGGTVSYEGEILRGKISAVKHKGKDLFHVTRYHSLAGVPDTVPEEFDHRGSPIPSVSTGRPCSRCAADDGIENLQFGAPLFRSADDDAAAKAPGVPPPQRSFPPFSNSASSPPSMPNPFPVKPRTTSSRYTSHLLSSTSSPASASLPPHSSPR
ncbi:hypothetical protein BC938DRAFT_476723 [Jimgerdemannia flammicorona]|uniref:Glutamine amidotransferase domain-containing protein n=1 Tax=Jimgerdemannia flammicorona TaxID=994334 RepID=A0A433QQ67_9FUNG|nr:hypothetical protein BC938DRAFT_476723 [Jimgerdemannia flammicorona]